MTAPYRRISARRPERLIIVDSTPTSQTPPSKIMSSFPVGLTPKSSKTCRAQVGEICPNVLQLGAVRPLKFGPEKRFKSSRVHGCEGQRRATESWSPVTKLPQRADFFNTSVKGPGQNVLTSRRASLGIFTAHASRASGPATWTMSGWLVGRFLTAKVARTASLLSASAARP